LAARKAGVPLKAVEEAVRFALAQDRQNPER